MKQILRFFLVISLFIFSCSIVVPFTFAQEVKPSPTSKLKSRKVSPTPVASADASVSPSVTPDASATVDATVSAGTGGDQTDVLGTTSVLGETSGLELAKWMLVAIVGSAVVYAGIRVSRSISHAEE